MAHEEDWLVVVHGKLSPTERDELDDFAFRENISRSAAIRKFVQRGLAVSAHKVAANA
jgi:hypothetical protein